MQLSQKTQKALIEKKITTGHAKVLVGLDEKQQQLIVDSVVGQKLSVREVEATIKSIKNGKTEPSHEVKISFDFKNAKEKLSALGFKIKNSGKSLTIEFDNENHISDFLNYFSK